LTQSVLPQLSFLLPSSTHSRRFSGGQITSDADLLPLRAFDQRHHLTRDGASVLSDPRQPNRLRHDSLMLLRQRIYQIVAGYEDANDADCLRHDPMLQIVADQKLSVALGSQLTLSRWENAPSARDLLHWNDRLGEHQERLERAIGVIYLPESERISHYFLARLAGPFDAVIHLDKTRAVEPLERA
jgi:hypothetical protein